MSCTTANIDHIWSKSLYEFWRWDIDLIPSATDTMFIPTPAVKPAVFWNKKYFMFKELSKSLFKIEQLPFQIVTVLCHSHDLALNKCCFSGTSKRTVHTIVPPSVNTSPFHYLLTNSITSFTWLCFLWGFMAQLTYYDHVEPGSLPSCTKVSAYRAGLDPLNGEWVLSAHTLPITDTALPESVEEGGMAKENTPR